MCRSGLQNYDTCPFVRNISKQVYVFLFSFFVFFSSSPFSSSSLSFLLLRLLLLLSRHAFTIQTFLMGQPALAGLFSVFNLPINILYAHNAEMFLHCQLASYFAERRTSHFIAFKLVSLR